MQSPSRDQLYEGTGLVLDDGNDPIICFGGVGESFPPHCDGSKLRGWSWDGLEFDEAAGTRWGQFMVRGTYVDGVFTLKDAPTEPKPYDGGVGVESPCPEPVEGWPIPDPVQTTQDDLQAAMRDAEDRPDYAGAWIDYVIEPTTEEEGQPWGENVILVLTFTGDAEQHEEEAREHWGGALCIWINDRPYGELERIQEELNGGWPEDFVIETTFSGIDVEAGTVDLGVIVTTPAFEAELNERYGQKTVVVQPALKPVG